MAAKGLLLLNLGSPRSPARADVKRYLDQFLTDPYVMDVPAWLRYPLVYGLITPFRSGKSAHAYQQVWRSEGAPLTYFTRTFAEAVRAKSRSTWDVRWAMRYGEPDCASALHDWKVDEIFIVPLYPQYAESSTRSALEQALGSAQARKVYWLQDFFSQSEFVEAQSRQISNALKDFNPDKVLFSFHGLPQHHLTKLHPEHCLQSSHCCDSVGPANRLCYRAQCMATSRALTEHLPAVRERILVSFQSRLGRRPWIQPYTDYLVTDLAAQGVKRLLVSSPSFVADCLETLEEVEIRLRDQFIREGGEELRMVPALNAEEHWIDAFLKMLTRPSLEWKTHAI